MYGESTILSKNHLNYNYYNLENGSLSDVAEKSKLVDIVASDKARLKHRKNNVDCGTSCETTEKPSDSCDVPLQPILTNEDNNIKDGCKNLDPCDSGHDVPCKAKERAVKSAKRRGKINVKKILKLQRKNAIKKSVDILPIIQPIETNSKTLPLAYIFPKPMTFNNIHKFSRFTKKFVNKDSPNSEDIDMFTTFLEQISRKKRETEPFLNIFNIVSSMPKIWTDHKKGHSKIYRGTRRLLDSNRMKPCLLDILKPTMKEIQKEKCPVLLIVVGGVVSEIRDETSETGSALKFVLAHMSKKRSTVIITEQCPLCKTGSDDDYDVDIPLYVRGPKSSMFDDVETLCDIPPTIEDLIDSFLKEKC